MDVLAESRFCIAEALKHQESVKRSSKLHRLNISDSLDLVKREKYDRRDSESTGHSFPRLQESHLDSVLAGASIDQTGMIELNRRYSMPREYRPLPPPEDENVYEQLSQHLRTRKLNRSKVTPGQGMDAFWTVRKQKAEEASREKKKGKKQGTASPLFGSLSVNPIESAFLSIMAWAKLPQDTSTTPGDTQMRRCPAESSRTTLLREPLTSDLA